MRIGIAGCGFATRSFHLPALRRIDSVRVVAVADLNETALAEVADRWAVPRRHRDAVELAADPEVDVVAVCLPPAAHVEVAASALEAGKHVLVEKPLALSLPDADRLVALADQAHGKATVGFNLRSHRLVRRARAELQGGHLGAIQCLESTVSDSTLDRPGLPEWRKRRERGGGALMDKAIHHLDLWRHLLDDEVKEVFAVSRSGRGDDQTVAVTGSMRGGAVATTLALDATSVGNELTVHGEAGSVALSLYRSDGYRRSGRDDAPSALGGRLARGAGALRELAAGLSKSRRGGDFMTSYVTQWSGFLQAIRDDTDPPCTLADGRRALQIALAAAQSAELGRPVEVEAAKVR